MGSGAPPRPHPFRWEFVEQSFAEADFLWRRRERALVAADYNLAEVGRLVDERLLGCFDGMLLAAPPIVERLLEPALATDSQPALAIAAYVLGSGDEMCWQALMAHLQGAERDRLTALVRGLELVTSVDIVARLQLDPGRASAAVLAAALDVCAFQRRDPGPHVGGLVNAGDMRLAHSVLVAARCAALPVAEGAIVAGLGLAPPARDAAIESGVIAGVRAARAACSELIRRAAPDCGPLLLLGALFGTSDREHRDVVSALGNAALAPDAVRALGFAGTLAAADTCVDLVRQGLLPELACEAFCMVTGVDLDGDRLRAVERRAEGAGLPPLEEDDLDGDLTARAGEGLPRADAGALDRWWSAHRGRFEPGRRYLLGRPFDRQASLRALREGPMRTRHGLALDLAIQSGGQLQLETRTWARSQQALLGEWARMERAAGPRGYRQHVPAGA